MNDSAASEQSPPAASPGAGALLLAERRRQGLSLGDISRQLKLSVRQVEALERDDYGVFRSPVFVHGFIRNYAKLLGMQAGPLIVQADSLLKPAETAKVQADAAAVAATDAKLQRKSPGLGRIAGGLALVLLLVAIMYLSGGSKNGDAPPPALDSAPPEAQALQEEAAVVAAPQVLSETSTAAPAAASVPEATTSGGGVIRMVFDQESWVEIKDGNGNTIFGQLMSAGSRRSVTGEPPLSVVIGNADGVQLSYQAKVIDLAPHTRVNVARLTLE